MKEIQKGSLERAALKAGICKRTTQKYKNPQLSSVPRKVGSGRGQPNPFEKHWEEIGRMLTRSPELEAQTIMTYLAEQYPKEYHPNNFDLYSVDFKSGGLTMAPVKLLSFAKT